MAALEHISELQWAYDEVLVPAVGPACAAWLLAAAAHRATHPAFASRRWADVSGPPACWSDAVWMHFGTCEMPTCLGILADVCAARPQCGLLPMFWTQLLAAAVTELARQGAVARVRSWVGRRLSKSPPTFPDGLDSSLRVLMAAGADPWQWSFGFACDEEGKGDKGSSRHVVAYTRAINVVMHEDVPCALRVMLTPAVVARLRQDEWLGLVTRALQAPAAILAVVVDVAGYASAELPRHMARHALTRLLVGTHREHARTQLALMAAYGLTLDGLLAGYGEHHLSPAVRHDLHKGLEAVYLRTWGLLVLCGWIRVGFLAPGHAMSGKQPRVVWYAGQGWYKLYGHAVTDAAWARRVDALAQWRRSRRRGHGG